MPLWEPRQRERLDQLRAAQQVPEPPDAVEPLFVLLLPLPLPRVLPQPRVTVLRPERLPLQ